MCLTFVFGGALFGLYWKNKQFRDTFTNIVKHPIDVFNGKPLASYKPAVYLADHPHTMNILFLGCDRDYVGKRINGVAVPVPLMNTNGRSDAILIAHYDFDKKTVSVLTIPRDTAVQVPGYSIHKINAAHQFGGPELTQRTIEEVFGIHTDAYVTLHFEAFQQIVDAVGGVDINVKKKLDYDDNWALLHIHLLPGKQHLDGYKAMGYVRIRHSDSDLMRAERQHEFVEALRDQIKSPMMLIKGANVLNSITDNLHTNLTYDQLITLAAWSKDLPKENITLATIPSIEGPSYVTVNKKPSRKLIAQMFFEGNEAAVNITAPDKEAVYAMNHRGGTRRHGHGVSHDASLSSGSDMPLETDTPSGTDGPMPPPDNSGDKPDPSSSGTKPDNSPPPPEKKSGEGDKGKDPAPSSGPTSAGGQLALLSFV